MSVTRYVTRDYQRESRDPYRTDPNLTGPTAYSVAASHHVVQLGDARDRDGMMRRHLTPAEFAAEWDRRTFGSMGVER